MDDALQILPAEVRSNPSPSPEVSTVHFQTKVIAGTGRYAFRLTLIGPNISACLILHTNFISLFRRNKLPTWALCHVCQFPHIPNQAHASCPGG
jgi:hypothetical protein